MEIQNLKKRFLEYLEVGLGRSQKTVENYDRALCVFLKYSKIKKASEITQDLIHDFRLWLNRRPGTEGTLKKNTQNKTDTDFSKIYKFKKDQNTHIGDLLNFYQTAKNF